MKIFLLALGLALALSAPALAQDDMQGTVNAINEAVAKAQFELAKQLGLLPAEDENNLAAEDAAAVEPLDEEAPADETPTIDIVTAEQQFWADFYASQSQEAAAQSGDQGEEAKPSPEEGEEGNQGGDQ